MIESLYPELRQPERTRYSFFSLSRDEVDLLKPGDMIHDIMLADLITWLKPAALSREDKQVLQVLGGMMVVCRVRDVQPESIDLEPVVTWSQLNEYHGALQNVWVNLRQNTPQFIHLERKQLVTSVVDRIFYSFRHFLMPKLS